MQKLRLLCALLLCLPLCSVAAPLEAPSFSLSARELLDNAGPADASNTSGVTVLLDETELKIDASNRIRERRHCIYRIDAANAIEGWSEVGARWSPWYQAKPQVRARVITSDGVSHELDPKSLSDAAASDSRPEVYDETRIFSGPLPALQVGAVVEEEEIIQDSQPFAHSGIARQVFMGRHAPVRESKLVVEAPASIPLKYESKLLPQLSVTKETADGVLRLTFVEAAMAAVEKKETDLPPTVPTWPVITLSTAPSWQAVAAEYRQVMEKQLAAGVPSAILPPAGRDRLTTVAALLAFLHREVRYTGVEFGDAGLVPRTPTETFQRKYGDCKDKATALVAMLRARNIPAEIALLRSGSGPDIDADFPGLGLFDHAIVYVPGTPDLWIDATSEFSAAGDLPYQDRGRQALVIADNTTSLTRIPEAKPEDDVDMESREFTLPENGPARVVEISEPRGTIAASYRSDYGFAADKNVHDQLERYVKSEYFADALTKLDHGDAADMSRPFQLRLEIAKSKRGVIEVADGAVAVRLESLFSQYPQYLKTAPPDKNDTGADAQPRVEDVAFQPFITEWHYKIVLPSGYRVRSLPDDQDRALGPARLTSHFETAADGTVMGIIRFNTGKGRYSPSEADVVRKAVAEISSGQALFINLENTGAALIASGQVREGLKSYRDMIALHPKEAIHHIQIARALLDLGLAEEARAEAREAVRLEAQSSLAYQTLAWVLEHDLVGRRFKKGFDREGAIAAYRRAAELDPKDSDILINLAILLEYDSNGDRYSAHSSLDQAIAAYRAARTIKDDPASNYADNLYYALAYARHFDEVKSEIVKLPQTAQRLKLLLVAIAATEGTAKAVAEAQKAREASLRASSLNGAGQILRDLRLYPQAADLIEASIQNGNSEPQTLAQVQNLRAIKHNEQVLLPASDPRSAVQRFYLAMLDPEGLSPAGQKEFEFIVEGPQRIKGRLLAREAGSLQSTFRRLDLPLQVASDAILSLAAFSSEGDDRLGYRVRMQSAGNSMVFYIARRADGYKIIGGALAAEGVGLEVLSLLQKNDSDAARAWLDRVRDEITIQNGDDPVSWPIFPRIWSRGDSPDADRMRLAAISLVADTDSGSPFLSQLRDLGAKVAQGNDRTYASVVLAVALSHARQWNELGPLSQQLLHAYPTSEFAFQHFISACTHLADWSGCQQAIADRLTRLPDDLAALRARATVATYRNHPVEVRAAYKALIDSGRGTAQDLNAYTWNSLFTHIDEGDLRLAQQANATTGNGSYAILHTLASLYAELGKTKEARDTLLHMIDVTGLSEPDTEVWYVLGRIAEQYGDSAAALKAYNRMDMSEFEDAPYLTTKDLVTTRLAELKRSGASAAAAAK